MNKFEVFYNRKKIEIEANSLWEAKKQVIVLLKVPKSKQGLIAIQSLTSKENQDFRFV